MDFCFRGNDNIGSDFLRIAIIVKSGIFCSVKYYGKLVFPTVFSNQGDESAAD